MSSCHHDLRFVIPKLRWIDLHAPEEPEVEAEEPKDAGS